MQEDKFAMNMSGPPKLHQNTAVEKYLVTKKSKGLIVQAEKAHATYIMER